MATAMIHDAPTAEPAPSVRLVQIRASLLPDEVVGARRARVVRKRVLLGLVAVAGLLIALFGLSRQQTTSAEDDLQARQRRHASLQSQQNEFGPLVTAQTGQQAIHDELQKLMGDDLSWRDMLTTLRAAAPAGVVLTDIGGKVTAGAASSGTAGGAPAAPSLNATGKLEAGTISLTGTAPSKNAVAAYADRLARVKGLAAPLITNVSTVLGTVTFTLDVVITSDALGGRYAVAPATSTGGR